MAIVPIKKIRIYSPTYAIDSVISVLHNYGVAELALEDTDKNPVTDSNHNARYAYAALEAARSYLTPYHHTGFLREIFEGGRAYTSAQELATLEKYNDNEVIEVISSFQMRQAELDRRHAELMTSYRVLDQFERLELPLSDIKDTRTTFTLAIRGTVRTIGELLTYLTPHETDLAITNISETTLLLTARTAVRNTIEDAVSTAGVSVINLPDIADTAAAALARVQTELKVISTAQEALTKEISHYAATHFTLIQKLLDIRRWAAERADTAARVENTGRTAMYTAWVPVYALPDLEEKLSQATSGAIAIEHENNTTDTPPTLISNGPLTSPFEVVTKLYGAPYHADLDPTPFLAFFFFLFFGFCLSDAGYGLVLMIVTGLIWWKFRLDTNTKQMVILLFFGGLGTLIMGILFGGYFGLSPAMVHPALVPLQQFDPINNPLPVFYAALALGFAHVAFGIFLNMLRQIRLQQITDAILDNGPWLYLFTLIAIALVNGAGLLPTQINTTFTTYQTYLFGSAVILLVATQGRSYSNPFMKLIGGILGLYGGVGYFADVLSYSRLMALGLATGALAFSINSIASFVGGDSLGIGTIFMVFVLIFGHTLNLAISLLGTFINSARLQFVEFFSKFSTGSGRPFTPFTKSYNHTIVIPDSPPSG